MKKLLLSLGTLAAVVGPVAAMVSCGTKTLKDLIKEDIKKINASDLSKEVKAQDVSKVKLMKNKKDLAALMESIFPKPKTPLELLRDSYVKKIQEINLPWTKMQAFDKRINETKDEDVMKQVIKEAKAAKLTLEIQNTRTQYSSSRGKYLADIAKMKILVVDKNIAREIIEGTTDSDDGDLTQDALDWNNKALETMKKAFDDAKAKEVEPTVKKASKDGFVITTLEGYKLYIPDGKKGTSVTLVDSTARVLPQSIVKYEVTTAGSSNNIPVVKVVKTDGTYSSEKVDVARAEENHLVLKDYSGAYYTEWNRLSASPYLINFLNANLRISGNAKYDMMNIKELLFSIVPNTSAKFLLDYDENNHLTACVLDFDNVETLSKDVNYYKSLSQEEQDALFKEYFTQDNLEEFLGGAPDPVPVIDAPKEIYGQTEDEIKAAAKLKEQREASFDAMQKATPEAIEQAGKLTTAEKATLGIDAATYKTITDAFDAAK